MTEMLRIMGPWGVLLLLLAAVILVLAVLTLRRLVRRDGLDGAVFQSGLNGILFWGAISAAIGMLGQLSGLWLALGVISTADEVSPRLVAQGLMESFSTTILGLAILVASAVAWFALRSWARRAA